MAVDPEGTGSPAAGHWEGAIELPGVALLVKVDLSAEGGVFQGTIDIPQQSAKRRALGEIAVPAGADGTVHFTIEGVPGAPTFDGTLAAGKIEGTFTQAGRSFSFRLGREALQPLARPQEPQPPFPYTALEVHYEGNGGQLAGTLTLPPGDGPFPAVILLPGGRNQESMFGHKPFLVLADHLTRAGIAVLVDKRGVGDSTGSVGQSTVLDFADDALSGVRFLQAHPRIAPDRIGLVGHSAGGLTAPLAASRSEDVAFVVILAGPAVPGEEIFLDQRAGLARAEGAPEEKIQEGRTRQQKICALLRTEQTPAALRAPLRDLVRAAFPEARQKALGASLELVVDKQVDALLTPEFRHAVTYDPRLALAQVKVPILALFGERDLQVSADLNVPELEKALQTAKNPDVTIRRLPELNHLFQHAKTGARSEYEKIEETISPQVLDLVTEWILERF